MVLRALLVAFALTCLPAPASAVTVRDIIELTKAGVSDAVLTALIDADRTVFALDADQILELRAAGVSEAVLLKMLASRREFESPRDAPPAHADAAPPQVVVIGGRSEPPAVTVVVPQYFYVPFPIFGRPVHTPRAPASPFAAPAPGGFGRFINDGWIGRR